MKILHTSDWHFGKTFEKIDRLEEQRAFVDNLCEIADRANVDLVLVAGDIFDTYNPSAAAEELFYYAVNRLNNGGERAIVVIAGNHDNPERLCASSSLAYKNGIILLGFPSSDAGEYGCKNKYLELVESGPGYIELSINKYDYNAVILTLPYPSEARLKKVLTDELDESVLQKAYSQQIKQHLSETSVHFKKDTVNLMVGHLFMMGGIESDSERPIQVGGALTVAPSAIPEGVQYAALGHLHRPQQVKNASSPVYYSGSPLQYSFSEAGYCKEVFIVDVEPGSDANVMSVPLNCPKPLKIWKVSSIEEAIAWSKEGRDTGSWIDLRIKTKGIITTQLQNELRKLNPGIVNIKVELKRNEDKEEIYEDRETKRIDDLFCNFYKSVTGEEIPKDLMETFVELVNKEQLEKDFEDKDQDKKDGEDYETQTA